MQKSLSLISASMLGLLISTTTFAADKVVATVNGKNITQETYEHYLKMRTGGKTQGVNREMVIQELVNRELLRQDAIKLKVDKDPDVKFLIEQQEIELLIKAGLQKSVGSKPISEKELKKEYEEKIANANVHEYKAAHILLKTEAEAKAVISQLDSGAVFADIAKAKSIDTGTKENGGDLGWFNPGQMVPAFSQAVAEMKPGTYSKAPVQSQYGWHVIKLEDTRKLTPPSFEDMKQKLQGAMQGEKVREHLMELQKKAKIDIKK